MAKSRERAMGTPAMRSLHLPVSISAIRTEATSNRVRRAHRCRTSVRPTVGGTAVASRLVDVAAVVGTVGHGPHLSSRSDDGDGVRSAQSMDSDPMDGRWVCDVIQ
jgi:hypothetical protein